jgi:hypothetical protein
MSTTQSPRNPVDAAREIVDHATRLARLEFELKLLEFRGKAVRLGIGTGFGLAALLLLPLVVLFALAAVAAALATTMSVWLAILIVAGILLVLVAALAGVGAKLVRGALKGGKDAGR